MTQHRDSSLSNTDARSLLCSVVNLRLIGLAVPRNPRIFLPNFPLHIIQRGHNQQPVFAEPADYEYYIENLIETKATFGIKIYGYCLMTNHVHLIAAPGAIAENVSKMMKVLAARQTRYVNKIEKRTGTLWEGRFKASLIDSDRYLLACYRYVDLNPVRASIVELPEQYPWCSYRDHTAITQSTWLDDSPAYSLLGNSVAERIRVYQSFVSDGTSDRELSFIRMAARRNQLTGSDKFRHQIEKRIGRRISAAGRGRPQK